MGRRREEKVAVTRLGGALLPGHLQVARGDGDAEPLLWGVAGGDAEDDLGGGSDLSVGEDELGEDGDELGGRHREEVGEGGDDEACGDGREDEEAKEIGGEWGAGDGGEDEGALGSGGGVPEGDAGGSVAVVIGIVPIEANTSRI